ncbi:MAG: carbamate kinase, partial [Peptoniphilus sp.]|nr:carbamate kinase [Peptoniphilus sp.]
TVGGGGIPVIETEEGFEGVPAVIDKDSSSAKLAMDLDADMLIILTAVEKVAINFNTENQKDLDSMTLAEVDKYIEEGQFAKGSMLPKVEACKNFVENSKKDAVAIITSL